MICIGISKSRCAGLIAIAGLLLIWTAAAQAQDKELRFALWVPPQSPQYKLGLVPWAKSLEAASGGSLKVTMFPAQQLGKAQDHYDMAVRGIADITFVNPGYTPGRFKILGATELPFLVSAGPGGSLAIYDWYKSYRESEMDDVKVCVHYVHLPGTLHSKAPVKAPTDIENLKVRPSHQAMAQLIARLGGTNVQIGAPEVGQALSTGVADAVTFPWSGLRIFRIEKQVTHHLDLPLYTTSAFIVVGNKTYDGLDAGQRKAVDAACTAEHVAKLAQSWERIDAKVKSELKASDAHSFHKPSAAELSSWRQAAAPLYDSYVAQIDKMGLNGKSVLNDLRAKLKAEGALANF